jgi:membrane fusion protein, multidrug efflux system
MKSSYIIAGVIAVAAAGWMISGQFTGATAQDGIAAETAEKVAASAPAPLASVRVELRTATSIQTQIVLKGYTAAHRRVAVPAQIDGVVEDLPVDRGTTVTAGAILARISTDERDAALRQAKTLVAQRRIEFNAAQSLSAKGYQTQVRTAETRALLDSAEASLKRAELEMADTTIKAPFDGVIEARTVELGAYVARGDSVASLVDLDPIKLVVDISERDIGRLTIGQVAQASLLDGTTMDAAITFIAPAGSGTTRTFRVELEADNKDGAIRDGLTTEVRLPLGTLMAHKISPAILSLADDGRIGVKIVENGKVRFVAISMVRDEPDGIWVGGLPHSATIITVGQEFVKDGQAVQAVDATQPGA